jgi:hypothetical protein
MANEELIRALNEANVGSVLKQPEVDKIVAQLVNYRNPLRMNMPRKQGTGSQWILDRRAPGNTPAIFVADTDTLTEATGDYTQVAFDFKTLAVQGRVTRKSQAIGMTFGRILADEMERKAEDFKDKEDHALLWGQKVAGTPITGIGGTKEFDGINALTGNTILVTTSINGAALTPNIMDKAIDDLRQPDLGSVIIIASFLGRRKLNALLQSQQRFVNEIEVKGGFRVLSWNNIPIFTSTNIPDSLGFNGSIISSLTGGSTTAIYVIDTSKVWVGELTQLAVLPLAKVSSQFDEFDMYEDITVVARDANAVSRIIGIANTNN